MRAEPVPARRVPPGKHDGAWGDQDGLRYELITDRLAPVDAAASARSGARVVYDACGCGGDQCRLDWLDADDVAGLASSVPVSAPSRNGLAALEHWRSTRGDDLDVVIGEVRWGDRLG